MPTNLFLRVVSVTAVCTFGLCGLGVAESRTGEAQTFSNAQSIPATVPVVFEPNRGQAPKSVLFLARTAGATIFFSRKGLTIVSRSIVRFDLCERDCAPSAEIPLYGVTNYFVGRDPRRWHRKVPQFARLRYRTVAPGVDVVFYSQGGRLEYDLVVRPGGDAGRFKERFAPGARLSLNASGDLMVEADGAVLTQHAPAAYEVIGNRRRAVGATFQISENTVLIEVEPYDRKQVLIIDPVLSYSTLLGGVNADFIAAVAVDSAGHAFVAGSTASGDFPDVGPFDCKTVIEGCLNDFDIVVTKLNASGTGILYSDIVGDVGDDHGLAIAIDSSGSAYVAGSTEGMTVPTIGPSGRAMAFVLKLNPQGSALSYVTQFGGCCESSATAIAVDSTGHAYVAGTTASSEFPVTPGALATEFGGERVGFLAKLNTAGTGFLYSSYIGPTADLVEIRGLATDAGGFAYLGGTVRDGQIPTTSGAVQHDFPSAVSAGFLLKVNATGTGIAYGTYFGGGIEDSITGLAIDSSKNAYVTGVTDAQGAPTAPTPPTTPGAFQRSRSGSSDAFVAKINPSGSTLLYSTLLGGGGRDRATGIALNSSGNAFVVGVTESSTFPTTMTAFQRISTGGSSGFVTKLNTSGTGLRYSSYLGGRKSITSQAVFNSPNGVAVSGGNAYVAGSTTASDFPATPGAFRTSNRGAEEGFITKVIEPACTSSTANPSVTICTPTANATVTSPVKVTALTVDTRPVRTVQVYLDGNKIYQASLSAFTAKFKMNVGTHRLTVQAIDTANIVFKKTVYVNVAP